MVIRPRTGGAQPLDLWVLIFGILCCPQALSSLESQPPSSSDSQGSSSLDPWIELLNPLDDSLQPQYLKVEGFVHDFQPGWRTIMQLDGERITHFVQGVQYTSWSTPQIQLDLDLAPKTWRLDVSVQDGQGHTIVEREVSFVVPVPDYAAEVQLHGTFDTLDAILEAITKEKDGCYLRFGDDIVLAHGGKDQMQHDNSSLSLEFQRALGLDGPAVFKTLMINSNLFGLEPGMVDGNHLVDDKFALWMIKLAVPFWKPLPITRVFSNPALSHAATSFPETAIEFLVELKRSNPRMLVGNENLSPSLISVLFGSRCHHVKTPPKNAYSSIDEIETRVSKLLDDRPDNEYSVLIVVMGPAGTALQQRLHRKKRLFTFDFGSLLDALSGWSTRAGLPAESAPAWIRVSEFNRTDFLLQLCSAFDPGERDQCLILLETTGNCMNGENTDGQCR